VLDLAQQLILGGFGIDACDPLEFTACVLSKTVELDLSSADLALPLNQYLLALGKVGGTLLEGLLAMTKPRLDPVEFDAPMLESGVLSSPVGLGFRSGFLVGTRENPLRLDSGVSDRILSRP
jgi:hypothetical protein